MPIEYEDTVSGETGSCCVCGTVMDEADENRSDDGWLCVECHEDGLA